MDRTCSESGTADSHPGGGEFVSEGVQKVLFPQVMGVGRFAKFGIPRPGVMAPFVGTIGIICGGLVLMGQTRRLAVIPLFGMIIVALYTAKISMISKSGVWSLPHDARTDVSCPAEV